MYSVPSGVEIERNLSEKIVKKGEEIIVNIDVEINNGRGPVFLHDEIPDRFELLKGNISRLVWKGPYQRYLSYSYTVRCLDEGTYGIKGTAWRADHILGMKTSRKGSSDRTDYLKVKSTSSKIKELKDLHLGDIPLPKKDISNIGVSTTDFKEVRDYNLGDPIRDINWKATARRGDRVKPLVNEYEVEGKKCAWIFLDASCEFTKSYSNDRIFDHCIEAADMFTHFFIDKDFLVGMYIYDSSDNKKDLFYPERGLKHYNHISNNLLQLTPGDGEDANGLSKAVERCRNFLYRYNPLPIVITNINMSDQDSLKNGIKKLRSLIGGRRKKNIPLIVLNVLSTPPEDDDSYRENTQKINRLERYGLTDYIKKSGGHLIEWDPKKERIYAAMKEVLNYES